MRVVAPVVAQAAIEQHLVVDEGMDRQQLDRRDAEAFQVADDRLAGQARVRAAQMLGDVWMALGQPLDVRLVDDRLVPGEVRLLVPLPIERGVDHDALGHAPGIIFLVLGEIGLLAPHLVGEDRRVPVDLSGERLRIGIDQQLGRIEAQAVLGVERPVDAIAIELSGADAGETAMVDVARDLAQLDRPHRRVRCRALEEAQLDLRALFCIQGEVDALIRDGGAQRVGLPRQDRGRHARSLWLTGGSVWHASLQCRAPCEQK